MKIKKKKNWWGKKFRTYLIPIKVEKNVHQ